MSDLFGSRDSLLARSCGRLYTGLIKGLKVYFFYLAVLCVFRALYIGLLADFLGHGTGAADILLALSRGARLSMQTTGVLTAVTIVPGLVIRLFSAKYARRVTLAISAVMLFVLMVLFFASLSYYQTFHANFNQMLLVGRGDDKEALFWTMVAQYHLLLKLVGALAVTAVLVFLLRALYDVRLARLFGAGGWEGFLGRRGGGARLILRWGVRVGVLVLCYFVARFSVFGGSLGWQTSVDWENAGVTRDALLNEAILDSPQAIYRTYKLEGRMRACNGLDFEVSDIKALAAHLTGKPADSDNLDDYLTREAAGAKIEKPRHVFIILSESLANWPLLPKYQDIPISTGLRSLIAEPDTDYCPTFLPNGASTVSAVTGVTTGFADANLYLTTMPEAFAAPYPTASAPEMARLGYRTCFFYAGPATWERIGDFTKAQGFDEFVSRGDFGDVPGSVWGAEDEVFYDNVLERIDPDTPSFDVLLNASNHSPYDLDLAAKGCPLEEIRASLPEDKQGDEELLRELGHYWYADQQLARFVRTVKEKLPGSVIVIVGDHADRYHLEKQPETYERYGIPFIITGAGIHKGILGKESAGSQIDIVPTLLDLIAPQGFRYEALGSSLAGGNTRGVNYGFWITRDAIGKADADPLVSESLTGGEGSAIDQQAIQDYINAIRSISWWRAKYGPILDQQILEEKGR